MAQAEINLKNAMELGDSQQVAEAQKQITKLTVQAERASSGKICSREKNRAG